ncbi:ClpXP adapter SpxH family protein [Salinibacillus kushneri]|uniref:ClpXP adapter SpxH family protein n=1 Tax=Salinibacillus kushneri TaxID=237682 RepID=UPI000B80B12E|nr:ClpXP adapter SpxH family protein [Salinibacillus kushneri]
MRKNTGPTTSSTTRNNHSQYGFSNLLNKPIEIYTFIDPLCPECWSLEPFLKKLNLEYGRFFKLKPIISGKLTTMNLSKMKKPKDLAKAWDRTASRTGMSCDGDLWLENPVSLPWLPSIAIKAAELQGGKSGASFLRKLQEHLFVSKENISNENILLQCAKEVNLDIEEFQKDLFGDTAKKALQCDLKLTREMDVDEIPAIVLFNQSDEQEGIKISGLYPYEVYVKVLCEMLGSAPQPAIKPPLLDFLKYYHFVASKEISVVFDWNSEQTQREMKKLLIKRQVEKMPAKYDTFWRYIGDEKEF